MPMLKGSLMLEGGSESHPNIRNYTTKENKYQAGGVFLNGATYIGLNVVRRKHGI